MPMNTAHRRLCSSQQWARTTEEQILPWALQDIDLGTDVLELGPGYGANLRVLVERVPRLTAVEIDLATVRLLERDYGARARIVHGDAADLQLPDGAYSAVVCFTMLHHVPTDALQDRIFAEAFRVLRPGGVFAGSDSQPSLPFRLLHIGDTMNTLDADLLPARLSAAGFTEVVTDLDPAGRRIRFRACRP
ncbi:class I SAM-dependent methyltransferase [Kitasatospora sp. NPDC049258]|uniref:class I SAM-dependent methyltransferase n=1 Tax=Kitasatospora sp. NPDC049258 TaxID=3155394 RepID=UPI00342A8723